MTAGSAENPYAGQGSVLLDIGGDVGALVVTTVPEAVGVEVEIRPAPSHHHGQHHHGQHGDHHHGHGHGDHGSVHYGDVGHLPHVAVVNRPVAGATVPSLVYPELVQGRYQLCLKGTDDVLLTVDITGGAVTTATWPA